MAQNHLHIVQYTDGPPTSAVAGAALIVSARMGCARAALAWLKLNMIIFVPDRQRPSETGIIPKPDRV